MEQINNDNFHCFIPVEFSKGEKDKKTGLDLIKIKGIISTSDEDQQGEFLDPAGFDLSRFVSNGQINWNHQSKTDANSIIGHPTSAKVVDGKEVHMTGVLYPDLQKTQDVVTLAKSLEKYGDGRRLGYSIEGKAVTRDPLNPKHITKAIITGVAVTPCPVNLGTSLELIKGFVNDTIEQDYDIIKSANGGETNLILDVTNPETGMRYTVDKSFNVKVEKAISTTSSAGVTKREDLEGGLKKLNDRTDKDQIKKAIVTLAAAHKLGQLSNEAKEKVKNFTKSIFNY